MKRPAILLLVVAVLAPVTGTGAESLRMDFSPSFLSGSLERIEAEQKTFACPRCTAVPRIDGALDDEAWQKIPSIGPLRYRKPATEVRVCYDDRALYLGVRCAEEPGYNARGEAVARDSKIWEDDCIEMWLDPSPANPSVHQFDINTAGAIYDARRGDTTYNPEWEHAVVRDAEGWSVEVAIPFAALGLEGPVARLNFNIGRNGPEITTRSWNSRYGNTSHSALLFEGAPPAAEAPVTAFKTSPTLSVLGSSLGVKLDRAVLRPGERWLEAKLFLKPGSGLQRCRVVASLYGLAGETPLETVSIAPDRPAGKVFVDLRRHGLEKAELAVVLFEGDKRTGVAKALLAAESCSEPLRGGEKIALTVDPPEGVGPVQDWPVTFGVPFAPGSLWDVKKLRLVQSDGRAVPFQAEPVGLWGVEGAAKWVRIDALVTDPVAGLFVEVGESSTATAPRTPLTVSEADGSVTIDTGVARYVLGTGPSPIREILLNDKRVASAQGARGLYVIDQTGCVARASAEGETMVVEAAGPVAACVRFEGFYRAEDGLPLARHVTRVECSAGKPFANVSHTLILIRDTNETWFKEIGWEFAVSAGANPRALFGVSRDDLEESRAVPLGNKTSSAFMLQDTHYRFGHGTNHFLLGRVDAAGAVATLLEGEECGDWAAVIGDANGLQLGCQDAARMHPKEFEVLPGRIVLKLFSNRAGEELDFRGPALVERWDLQTWHDKVTSRRKHDPDFASKIKAYKSNAQGWARTHRLLVCPVSSAQTVDAAARRSRLHTKPVCVHVDPWWIYRSKALGPVYPRDPKRFPATERLLDDAVSWWIEKDAGWGENGFVDYYAGPHIDYRPIAPYAPQYRYVHTTYTLRNNLWLLYARSGQRRIREFAEGTHRTQMDGVHAHWNTPSNTRGLFRSSRHFGLPFYWGSYDRMEISSSSNMDDYLTLYYLTGDRRARDCVIEYGEGIKEMWTPASAKRTSRILMATRLIAQCYGLTWDPALKELAEATTDLFEDREGALLLTKERPNSSTYKTQVDIRALLDCWRILGDPRYHDMAMRVSKFWWRGSLGSSGYGYNPPMAIIGNFLYNETQNPLYAQALATSVRHHASTYDPARDEVLPKGVRGAYSTSFSFEIGYALDVITRTDADRQCVASWVGFEDVMGPATVLVQKPAQSAVGFQFSTQADRAIVGNAVGVRPVNAPSNWGQDLHRVVEIGQSASKLNTGDVTIPKDAPGGQYEIAFSRTGQHFLFADSGLPMVLHAPGYWYPRPNQEPPARFHFQLPPGNTGAQILFEGSARLFLPDGKPYRDGEALGGWVDLPDGAPGLWSFEPVSNKLVRARNFPPFFAFQSADAFFMPDVEWAREPRAEVKPPLPFETVYAPGLTGESGDRAVYLTGKRGFQLKPGEDHPSGDGGLFLPHRKGTIEFWMKPEWSSTDMPEGDRSLCWARTGLSGTYYTFKYMKKGSAKDVFCYINTDGDKGLLGNRLYARQIFFERGEWVHVAFVWGQRDGIDVYPTHKLGNGVFVSDLYINGKATRQMSSMAKGNHPAAPIALLYIGDYRSDHNINALVDELRISDVQRYRDDFTPSRDRRREIDEHTRALFHFDGDLKGTSHATEEPLEGEFTE